MPDQGDESHHERTRNCPACRSAISVWATTCRFCGRDVPRPFTEVRRLSARELAGEPVAATDGVAELGPLVRDLTLAARKGEITPVYGRDREVSDVVGLLAQEAQPPLLLVGFPGVGKTALIEAVALELVRDAHNPDRARWRIVQIELASMKDHRIGLTDRLSALSRLGAQMRHLVVFIDDVFSVAQGTHVHGSPERALCSMIKNRDIRCIGTMTPAQYETSLDVHGAVFERFEVYRVEPLDEKATKSLLQREQARLEGQYGVRISDKAISAAVELAREFIPHQYFPGKALEVLKHACNRYKRKCIMAQTYPAEWQDDASMRQLGDKVRPHDVKRAISEITSIDIDAAEVDFWKQKLAQRLGRYVFGQEPALREIAAAVAQVRLRFRTPGRPAGALLFGGPTGVGKVHTARVLARQLLGNCDDLAILDMAEYADADGVEKLFGFVVGKGGSLERGALACVIRDTPFAIVVLEGIERAHPDVVEALAPVIATGACRDAQGHELSLTKCLLILTLDCPPSERLFSAESLKGMLSSRSPRELVERMDSIVPFQQLAVNDIRDIAQRTLEEFYEELSPRGIRMRVHEAVYKLLAAKGYDQQHGVANLPILLEQAIVHPIREVLAAGGLPNGGQIELAVEKDGVVVKAVAPAE